MKLNADKLRKRLSHYSVSAMEASGAWGKKRRLAAAMRRVIDLLVQSNAPEDELEQAAIALERYGDRLESHPKGHKYEGFAETSNAGTPNAFFDQSPIIGLANPLAPPLELRAEEDKVHGTANFGAAYEGPPGCVHGGWVAAAFDELLGFAQTLTGNPGMTGTLNVVYRRPTPLKTDLRFEARVDRVEGRKIFAVGQLFAGDQLTAEATGIFISFKGDKFQELIKLRQDRQAKASE
jgi:acyl-coenzyme A thioesterase PaaI-like protein